MKALSFPVSENKNFKVDLLCSYVLTYDPRGGSCFEPGASYKKCDKGPLLDATCQISKTLQFQR